MLCQFIFQNFKSYRNEVTLDLCPANISEHPETLIVDKTDNTNYLPVAAIYGPNGGGKSNVIEAFYFLKRIVLTPPKLDANEFSLDDESNNQFNADQNKRFLFDDSEMALPFSFEVVFRAEGYEYKYTIKLIDGLIVEENLYATDTLKDIVIFVFERVKDSIKLGELLESAITDSINPAMPLIQYLAATYDFEITRNVTSWFKATHAINLGNLIAHKSLFLPHTVEEKELFLNTLIEMDINIRDIQVDRNENGKIVSLSTKYQVAERTYSLSLLQESAGTQKLFSFLMWPLKALENGSVLFVDELDAKLHPKMIEYIIKLFTNPFINKRGAQLITTSHDLYTMNNAIFRRDEIWFAAKGDDMSSRLYSLSEFKKDGKKARKDESYGKQYIEGRYGADPYLKKIINWEA